MSWVRQHCEGGRGLVVARVVAEGHVGFTVRLMEPGASAALVPANSYYASRAIAFDLADALVRHRYSDHACSDSCSGWVEDAGIR